MRLINIPLDPNCSYLAEGHIQWGNGTSIISENIVITTDETSHIKTFHDGAFSKGIDDSDLWDYLKIKNLNTEEILDLRLHTAALNGSVEMAIEAINEGADVNLAIKQKSTPLHWAAAKGLEEIVMLLLDNGAYIDATDELGWTPVFLALNGGYDTIVSLLVSRGAKRNAIINGNCISLPTETKFNNQLIDAAENGDLDAVKTAMNEGADINCRWYDGWTPLLSAVHHESFIIDLLLSYGADPNIASGLGYTPLMRAAGLGNVQVVKLLLAAGADKKKCDCDGKTASQLAWEMSQFECANLVS